MALRNIYDSLKNDFNISKVDTDTIKCSNGSQHYSHFVDSEGKYHIQNDAIPQTKLLSFNSDGTLASSKIKAYADAVNNTVISHASLINNHASTLADHDDMLSAHDDRILAIEGVVDPMTYVNAVTFGTTYSLATVPIASNKRGFLAGKVYFQNGFIEFLVYCKNISGTVTIQSWNLDYFYIDNSTSMQFDVSTTNIVIKLTGLSSIISARLAYDTDFMTA